MMKVCRLCNVPKGESEFNKSKHMADGLRGECRECQKKIKREWYVKNQSHCLQYRKKYSSENVVKIRLSRRIYNVTNIADKREYENRQYHSDEQFRNAHNARIGIWQIIKKGNGGSVRVLRIVGCTREKLMNHLETQFKPGMDWDNYGKLWEIDHIIPLSKYDLTVRQNIILACNYKNLQPLLVIENKIKGNKILI